MPTTKPSNSFACCRPIARFGAVKLEEEEAADVPAITDINELTKQTQSEVTAKALRLALQMVDYESGAMRMAALRKDASPQAVLAPRNRPETGDGIQKGTSLTGSPYDATHASHA